MDIYAKMISRYGFYVKVDNPEYLINTSLPRLSALKEKRATLAQFRRYIEAKGGINPKIKLASAYSPDCPPVYRGSNTLVENILDNSDEVLVGIASKYNRLTKEKRRLEVELQIQQDYLLDNARIKGELHRLRLENAMLRASLDTNINETFNAAEFLIDWLEEHPDVYLGMQNVIQSWLSNHINDTPSEFDLLSFVLAECEKYAEQYAIQHNENKRLLQIYRPQEVEADDDDLSSFGDENGV